MPKNPFKYEIFCSKCHNGWRYTIHNKKDAIGDARKRGWIIGKEYNICPKCSGKG